MLMSWKNCARSSGFLCGRCATSGKAQKNKSGIRRIRFPCKRAAPFGVPQIMTDSREHIHSEARPAPARNHRGESAIANRGAGFVRELLFGVGEVFGYLRPVDCVPPCLDIFGPAVLIFQVVGMFPDVETKKRLAPSHEGFARFG